VKTLELIFTECRLYGLQSKKILKEMLKIPSEEFFKQANIASRIRPYISNNSRLIEVPDYQLKRVQKRIKLFLDYIKTPEYVFSGIKGRSYVNHAILHEGNKFVYAIDITAFFPSIAREKVYRSFKDNLKTSPDIAEILTNLTTINLDLVSSKELKEIKSLLLSKGVSTMNHLISGSPSSPIMSYLVNSNMFNELNSLARKHNMLMTVYIDDIIFSSNNVISRKIRRQIRKIITKYHYKISHPKEKGYSKHYPKRITGVIINKSGNISIPNNLRQKIITESKLLQQNPLNTQIQKRLLGLVSSARQIEPNAFPSIYRIASKKKFFH